MAKIFLLWEIVHAQLESSSLLQLKVSPTVVTKPTTAPTTAVCPPNKHSVTIGYKHGPVHYCECNSVPMPTCMWGGTEQVVIDDCPMYRCKEKPTTAGPPCPPPSYLQLSCPSNQHPVEKMVETKYGITCPVWACECNSAPLPCTPGMPTTAPTTTACPPKVMPSCMGVTEQ